MKKIDEFLFKWDESSRPRVTLKGVSPPLGSDFSGAQNQLVYWSSGFPVVPFVADSAAPPLGSDFLED